MAVEQVDAWTGSGPAGATPTRRAIRVGSIARNWLIGGDERRLWETSLAMAAVPGAVEHTVFVLNDPERLTPSEHERWVTMRAAYAEAGVEVVEVGSPVDMRTPRDAVEVARLVRRLARELRLRGIQVVDARSALCAVIGVAAARRAGVPVTTLTTYYTSDYEGWYRAALGQLTLAGVDAVISDAQATLDDFSAWRWSTRADLVRIRNGFTATDSELDRDQARAALGIPADWGTVVGQVSRILPRKGWEVFIDAAAEVAAVRPEVRFVGVGFVVDEEREYFRGLERRVQERGLSDRFRFVAYPGPVADVHRAIDVFAHLSTIDSQPMAIHEAMAAGTPSVISALPGNREIVIDHSSGLLCEPGSSGSAAAAILELVDDPALGRELAAEGRRRFLTDHTPQVLAEAHIELFGRLLGRAAGRTSLQARGRG